MTFSAEQIATLRALAAAATEQSGSATWICGAEREDGTAQVYSPNRGPARVVVPVAETSKVCGDFIAAWSPASALAALDRIEELGRQCAMAESIASDRNAVVAQRDEARTDRDFFDDERQKLAAAHDALAEALAVATEALRQIGDGVAPSCHHDSRARGALSEIARLRKDGGG